MLLQPCWWLLQAGYSGGADVVAVMFRAVMSGAGTDVVALVVVDLRHPNVIEAISCLIQIT